MNPVVVFGDISTMVQSPTIDPIILVFEEEEEETFYDGTMTDDQSIGSSTTTEFLSKLKEEVVLQSLLHKRIHERKERVFQLQHRNGRRLLVVLPPDIQSVSSFEEEARKTKWVDTMLNTPELFRGCFPIWQRQMLRFIPGLDKTGSSPCDKPCSRHRRPLHLHDLVD